MTRRIVLALLAAVTVAGCGEAEEAPSPEEDDVVAVIERASTENDPDFCTELFTQQFVEQTTTALGEQAMKICEKSEADPREEPVAESVEVSDVEVEGTAATATAAYEGGSFGTSTVDFELVLEDDVWKLDRIDAIPELDAEALVSDITEDVRQDRGIPDRAVECIGDEFDALSDAELEELIVSGDPRKTLEVILPCLRGLEDPQGTPAPS